MKSLLVSLLVVLFVGASLGGQAEADRDGALVGSRNLLQAPSSPPSIPTSFTCSTQNRTNCTLPGSPGLDCCSGRCVDRQTDENNCGLCTIRCFPGFTCCGGSCKNLNNDGRNCGSCGNECPLSFFFFRICRNGVCV